MATGKARAEGICGVLEVWNAQDVITKLIFDATASNSCWKGGTVKLPKGLIGRKPFYYACHHHSCNLIIKAVYKEIFGVETNGLENIHFKRFKAIWKDIDKSKNADL